MPKKKVQDDDLEKNVEMDSPRSSKKKKDRPTVINCCGQRVTVDRTAGIVGLLVLFGLVLLIVQGSTSTSPSTPTPTSTSISTSTSTNAYPASSTPSSSSSSSSSVAATTTTTTTTTTTPDTTNIPPADSCTASEIAKQVGAFTPIKDRVWYWGCSPDSWWELVYSHSPSSTGKVFVDIGMNKGYMGAAWYALWNPKLGLTPQTLGNAVRKVPPIGDQDCGACGDCNDKVKPSKHNPTEDALIKVHGFDGAKVTVEKHHKIVREYFPIVEGYWTSSHNAVSDHLGTIEFPNVLSEVASLHINKGLGSSHKDKIFNKDTMVSVNLTTVDTFFKEWQVDELFVLKIDTEGNDPSVLKGANDLLKHHRTHIVQFEYHNLGLWASQENLADYVTLLDDYGYTCFLLAHECTHILTKCWSPVFEFRTWSNVMCISRLHEPNLIKSLVAKSYAKQDAAACPMPK